MCFRLSGDLWVLSPESVREACKQDGRVGSARVAPIGWCREGFREDLNFYLVSCGNSLLRDPPVDLYAAARSEEHTSELQSLMRISYAVFCLKKKKHVDTTH